MKSLQTIMKETFVNYLNGINVDCTKSMKLSELVNLTKKNNSNNPHRAVGLVTESAILTFEGQNKKG